MLKASFVLATVIAIGAQARPFAGTGTGWHGQQEGARAGAGLMALHDRRERVTPRVSLDNKFWFASYILESAQKIKKQKRNRKKQDHVRFVNMISFSPHLRTDGRCLDS